MASLSVDFTCSLCGGDAHGVPFGGVGETVCPPCHFGNLSTVREDLETVGLAEAMALDDDPSLAALDAVARQIGITCYQCRSQAMQSAYWMLKFGWVQRDGGWLCKSCANPGGAQ